MSRKRPPAPRKVSRAIRVESWLSGRSAAAQRERRSLKPPTPKIPINFEIVRSSLLNAGLEERLCNTVINLLKRKELSGKGRELYAEIIHLLEMMEEDAVVERLKAVTPPFIDLQVKGRKNFRYSASVMARSLLNLELRSSDAQRIADAVEEELRAQGLHEVSRSQLIETAAEIIARKKGAALAQAYRRFIVRGGKIQVLNGEGGEVMPFSKGILMQSLAQAGADLSEAKHVTDVAQNALFDRMGSESRPVTRSEIREITEQILGEQVQARPGADPRVKERYQLLRQVRHLSKPLMVLIGGVSGTGKSKLASEVAYRLGIPRIINSDSVREVMRAIIPPTLAPTLHSSSFEAWQQLLPHGAVLPPQADELSLGVGFREQVRQVSVGLEAIVQRLILENADTVAEGVHLTPGFVTEEMQERATVVQVLLTVKSREEHGARFKRRGEEAQGRPQSRYSDRLNEIRMLQVQLIESAERANVPVLSEEHANLGDLCVDLVLTQISQHKTHLIPEDAEGILLHHSKPQLFLQYKDEEFSRPPG